MTTFPSGVETPHHRATLRQCVLRLHDPAAAMRPCDNRPALAWTLRELSRFGVDQCLLVAPGPGPAGFDEIGRYLPKPMQIDCVHTAGRGLGDAVRAAADRLRDRFLLCDSGTLFDANLADVLAHAATTEGTGYRLLLQGDGGDVADSGVRLLGKDAASGFDEASLQDFICRGDVVDGSAAPALLRRNALFLDRDGVLNLDHGYVGSRDRFEWVPGAVDAVRYATHCGWHVFVVTNQSGIARGLYDEPAVNALLDWIADEARVAGGTVDDVRFCPYHPEATVSAYRQAHSWRKPEPGMLLDLIRAWDLDPRRAIMVGDQPTDMQAAAAADVEGHLFPGGNLLSFVRPLLDQKGSIARFRVRSDEAEP